MIAAVAGAWSVNRAAGIAAMLLASLSIVLGIMQSARRRNTAMSPIDRHTLHEAIAIGTLVMIGLHVLAFGLDGFFKVGLVRSLIPFASPYKPLAVAAGQIAAYGLAGLSLTFYLRRRIGTLRWRAAHRLIPVFWGLAVLHGIVAGTDATRPWFLLAVLPPVAAAAIVLASRWGERAKAEVPVPSGHRPARSGSARGRARPTRTAPGVSRAGR